MHVCIPMDVLCLEGRPRKALMKGTTSSRAGSPGERRSAGREWNSRRHSGDEGRGPERREGNSSVQRVAVSYKGRDTCTFITPTVQ